MGLETRASCEVPALSPGVMGEVPAQAAAADRVGRGWYLWLTLPLENMGTSLARVATEDHKNVQRLNRTSPLLTGCGTLESQFHLSLTCALHLSQTGH